MSDFYSAFFTIGALTEFALPEPAYDPLVDVKKYLDAGDKDKAIELLTAAVWALRGEIDDLKNPEPFEYDSYDD